VNASIVRKEMIILKQKSSGGGVVQNAQHSDKYLKKHLNHIKKRFC
jgi:hypothetical protein